MENQTQKPRSTLMLGNTILDLKNTESFSKICCLYATNDSNVGLQYFAEKDPNQYLQITLQKTNLNS